MCCHLSHAVRHPLRDGQNHVLCRRVFPRKGHLDSQRWLSTLCRGRAQTIQAGRRGAAECARCGWAGFSQSGTGRAVFPCGKDLHRHRRRQCDFGRDGGHQADCRAHPFAAKRRFRIQCGVGVSCQCAVPQKSQNNFPKRRSMCRPLPIFWQGRFE